MATTVDKAVPCRPVSAQAAIYGMQLTKQHVYVHLVVVLLLLAGPAACRRLDHRSHVKGKR